MWWRIISPESSLSIIATLLFCMIRFRTNNFLSCHKRAPRGFHILWITWPLGKFRRIGLSKTKTDSFHRSGITFGRIRSCLNIAPTKWSDGVCRRVRCIAFLHFVILLHVAVILVGIKRPPRFYKAGFIGPQFLKMPINFVELVCAVIKWVRYLIVI